MNIGKAFLHTFLLFLFLAIIGGILNSSGLFLKYREYTSPVILSLSFFFCYWFFYKLIIKKTLKNEISEVRKFDDYFIAPILIIAIGLKIFEQPIFDLLRPFTVPKGLKEVLKDIKFQNHQISVSYLLTSFVPLILSPVLEELFFRKYLLSELLKRNSIKISLIVSSVCFSLMHLPNFVNLIPTFLLGLISGYIFIRTKNISMSIFLHFISNLIVILLNVYGKSIYENLKSLDYNLWYWMLSLLGAVLVFVGIKIMENRIMKINPPSNEKNPRENL